MIDALRAPGGARLVLLSGIAVLGAGLYLQAAGGPVLDSEAPALRALAAVDIGRALAFQTDPDEARPLASLLVYLVTSGSGTMASIRILSALLHGVNALLVLLLAVHLRFRAGEEKPGTALAPVAAGLVFALHPLASEAILSHASFGVVAGASCALGALLLAARQGESPARGSFGPAALYLASLLCHAAYWPVALPAALLASRRWSDGTAPANGRSFFKALAPFAAGLGLFYAAWTARMWPAINFGPVRRPWGLLEGLASQCAALVDALRLCLAPAGLSVDQGRRAYVGDWNVQALAGALALALLLAGAVALARRGTLVGVALGWLGAIHLHLLLAPPEEPLQERRLYPFVVTAALLASALIRLLEERAGSRAAVTAAGVICLPLAFITAERARLWSDPVALWESAVRVNPASARGYIALGKLHLERNETEPALQAYEAALARSPNSAPIQNSIAEVYFQRGDQSRALQEADKAIEMDPRYLPAYLTAGNVFMLRSQTRDAFLAFNAALTIDPEDPSALYNMGVLHYQERQYGKAARLLERAVALRPGDAEMRFRLGLSRFYQGDFRGAAEALRASVLLDPGRIDARVNLAAALTRLGEHTAADHLLEGVLGESPANAEALNGMAILASARNENESAVTWFEKAVSADPDNLQFLYNLGGAYEEIGRIDPALDAYRRFLDRWRGSLDLGEKVRARIEELETRASASP